MGQSGFAMLMLAGCCGRCELLAMAAAVGIPPIGHEYSWAFLIHDVPLVAVAGHRHRSENVLHYRAQSKRCGGRVVMASQRGGFHRAGVT